LKVSLTILLHQPLISRAFSGVKSKVRVDANFAAAMSLNAVRLLNPNAFSLALSHGAADLSKRAVDGSFTNVQLRVWRPQPNAEATGALISGDLD
jgi:hypothetical protein